jgi:phosphoadenosine phosphosulfate reductase
MTLADKIEESKSILRYAIREFGDSLALTFSGGKDSLVVLHLTQSLCEDAIPYLILSIDTTVKFPETIQFRDKISSLWNLNLMVIENRVAAKIIEIAKDKQACCQALKIQPLNEAIVNNHIRALVTAIRWDEQGARGTEQPISPRQSPPHTRIHPILHFTEEDIWDYIHAFELPYCELYNMGYRSLSCMPCTEKCAADSGERMGRSAEKEAVMNDLRLLGYF